MGGVRTPTKERLLIMTWPGSDRLSRESGPHIAGRVALAAATAVALVAAGGCADSSPPRPTVISPAAAPTKDLKAWLLEGAEKVGQDTFTVRFTMKREATEGYPLRLEMKVDPARRRSDMAVHFPVRQPGQFQWIEVKTIDERSWIRFFGFGEPPKGWIPADLTRMLGEDSSLLTGTQLATDLRALVETAVEPRLVTERAVRGSLDLRQHPRLTVEARGSLPVNAAVPFTATLDPQDRITNLTIHFNQAGVDGSEWQLLYSSFGSRLPIEAPPVSEVLKPDDIDPRLLSYLKNAAPE